MLLATLGDFLWSLLIIFFMVAFFMLLFMCLMDLFSDPNESWVKKTLWILFMIFLPFIGIFAYLLIRGRSMDERRAASAAEAQQQMDAYIKSVAKPTSSADQIAKANELLAAGAITQAEYDQLKAEALATPTTPSA